MSPLDFLHSLGNAFSHRLRAALTLLGIVIGSGSIVLLASLIGAGTTYLVSANQTVSDDDVVQARAKDPPPEQRERTSRPLTRADAEEVQKAGALEGAMVAPERSEDVAAHFEGRTKNVAIVSSSAQTLALYRLNVAIGRPLDDEDRASGRRVAVVGHEVHEELLRAAPLAPSLTLEIDGRLFAVVGVLAKKPMMGAGMSTFAWDRKVLVPETTYDAIYSPTHEVSRICVRRPSSKEGRQMTRATVQSVLLRRHFGVVNFNLQKDQSGGTEQLIFDIVRVLLLGTGVLALLASGINIMNVMLVTVSERTREIGLRRAIGATPKSILVQFLLESATLSFTGGMIGVATGAFLAWVIALAARSSFGHWDFVVPAWSVALGLSLAVVTGLVFGILPAWRASRVSPIEALRAE
jgi:putative ABC transport system permease protein